jgi:Arabinofuranosyltransferase N terminal
VRDIPAGLRLTRMESIAEQPPYAVHGRSRMLNPSLAALITWLVCLPVAFAVANIGPADPFHLRTAMIPLVIAVAGVVVIGIAASWWPADLTSGIAAGLLGGWVAFTLRLALHGTPYGFDGLGGDAGRMAAMANRYASAARSSDGIVPSVPSHYPPLFPWLVGRTAALVQVPAWRLLGPAEAITLSFAVVAGFVLWRLLVPGPLALALTLPVLLSFSLPEKAYEIVALAVLTPWVLATFGQPPQGRRLHWLPAGLIGGLSVVLYWAFTMYAALGIVALIALTWRASPQRAQYVRHVVLTVVVAAVVASWYLVPYVGWSFLHTSSQVDDLYQGGGISDSPLTFLAMTPLGLLELIGLAGLVWWRGRVWWGQPLLLLTGSAYAYWLICLALFSVSGHTALLQDTPRVIEPLLAIAGVLTIVQVSQGIVRRLAVGTVPAGLPTVALCLLALWTAVTVWQAWMPGGPGTVAGLFQPAVSTTTNETTGAFITALPDGSYPRFGPVGRRQPWFPVDPIKADVASVVGAGASPVTLSSSEELFPFVNWPGYVAVAKTAAGTNTDWPARYAALQQLSAVTDPATFAIASAHTAFGPIDVFILQVEAGRWIWTPVGTPKVVSFSRAQFSQRTFTVFTGLPGHLVVAVRRPSPQG